MGIGRDRTLVGRRVSTWLPAGTAAYDTAVLSDSPVFYYKFNEANASAALVDYSPNGRNGFYGSGDASYPAQTFQVAGPSNTITQGVELNPSSTGQAATWGTAVTSNWNSILFDGNWTWEVWYRHLGTTSGLGYIYQTGHQYLRVAIDNTAGATTGTGGVLYLDYLNSVSGRTLLFSSTSVAGGGTLPATSTWYHLAVVSNSGGGLMQLYINGTQRVSSSSARYAGNLFWSAGTQYQHSGAPDASSATAKQSSVVNGSITAMATYGRAFTAAEVLARYNLGIQ